MEKTHSYAGRHYDQQRPPGPEGLAPVQPVSYRVQVSKDLRLGLVLVLGDPGYRVEPALGIELTFPELVKALVDKGLDQGYQGRGEGIDHGVL